MTHSQIRELFYDFFTAKGHRKVLSSPLVPAKDPTLLFTNAGMNQFKGVFLREEVREYARAVSIQKCMRVSGKHNDFDEVGKTDFHHTFFEMLGNFSFGDYFKEPAISYAWEFLTSVCHLDPKQLWITVFLEDDEAASIWERRIGIPPSRIVRCGEEENFWQMGDVGPCGPCSEVHYDRGDAFGPPGLTGDNRRYVEVWNLVFMQYLRDKAGTLHKLPAPSIDTGMGMERLAAILQGKLSNFQTDLFRPIIEKIAELAKVSPDSPGHQVDFNVIADHARALCFLVSDGVIPANDGRGYVLRRLLRRAVKHGKSLSLDEGFLGSVCDRVIEIMSPHYPELAHSRLFTLRILTSEEERFARTLTGGLKIFEELMAKTQQQGEKLLPGQQLFRLADTYGFPLDFARDLAMEKGLGIDSDAFEKEMERQRQRSRSSQKEKRQDARPLPGLESMATEFVGYDELELEAKVLALFRDQEPVAELGPGESGILVVDRTPFYAQSGGQVGDTGTGHGLEAFLLVLDTQKGSGGAILHRVQVESGRLRRNDSVRLEVDRVRRAAVSIHHSVTHLLQAALRETLGAHVKQSGSYVGPEKLRFDFTHFQPLRPEEIDAIEAMVNAQVRENLPVSSQTTRYEEAIALGAIAIFEEKYGDRVRMVRMGDFSNELCGGTHLCHTGQIGVFKILSESSSASGIRRIEAVAGEPAFLLLQRQHRLLGALLAHFNQSEETLLSHLQGLEKRIRDSERESKKKQEAAPAVTPEKLIQQHLVGNHPPAVVAYLEDIDPRQLGALADAIKEKIRGVAVLFTVRDEKTSLVTSVHQDLTSQIPAHIIIKKMIASFKGRGGGRADFAQAGGERIASPAEFREAVIRILEESR